MTRIESERDDLFAETTAFVRRAEFVVDGNDEAIVFGERRDGAWSIYFGSDPVFHFDGGGRLKRAFVEGKLYRTQGDTLAVLTRQRNAQETILMRRDLPENEREQFLAAVRARLAALLTACDRGDLTILRSAPADDEPRHRLATRLTTPLFATDVDFLAPRFRGKR